MDIELSVGVQILFFAKIILVSSVLESEIALFWNYESLSETYSISLFDLSPLAGEKSRGIFSEFDP